MERLGLEKFKDVVVDKEKLNSIRGGESMCSETCNTEGGWMTSDSQTDYYYDSANDNCYEYGGFSTTYYVVESSIGGMTTLRATHTTYTLI